MIWNWNIEDRFVSVGRDGVIVFHYVENAEHPIDYISDVCADTSPNMDIAFAGFLYAFYYCACDLDRIIFIT